MEFFGIGASDGSPAKVVGSARLRKSASKVQRRSGCLSRSEGLVVSLCGQTQRSFHPVCAIRVILDASTGNTDGPALVRFASRRAPRSLRRGCAPFCNFELCWITPFSAQTDGSESVGPVLGMMATGLIFFFVSLILLVLQFFTSTSCGGAKGGLVMYYATGALGVLSGLLFLVGAIVFATAEDKDVICWKYDNDDTLKDPSCGFGAAFVLSLIAGLLGIVYGILYFVLLKIASVVVVTGAGAVAEAASKA